MDGWWGKSGRCAGVGTVEINFRHAKLADEMRIVLLLQMDASIDITHLEYYTKRISRENGSGKET